MPIIFKVITVADMKYVYLISAKQEKNLLVDTRKNIMYYRNFNRGQVKNNFC